MNSSKPTLFPPPAPDPVAAVIAGLWGVQALINSESFAAALGGIDAHAAADLRAALLRPAAFLDDSISNPYLGSLFDRAGRDPLNGMASAIAAAYGVAATYASTTGTSALNAPAVMTLAAEGEQILVGRDAHVSVTGGLALSGAEPHYLVPKFDAQLGVLLPPSPAEVAALLDAHPGIRAACLTMPTYHGLMGDVAGIVGECHRRGVLVMVDGAHGPHLHFLRELGMPMPAEDAGADLVTQSTHKVLAAMNQGSLLHFHNRDLLARYEQFQAMGFQSTSFSYVILMSIEHAIDQMVRDGRARWAGALERAQTLRERAGALPGIRVLDEALIDGRQVVGIDKTRVTINVRDTGLTGHQVAEALLERGLVVEMATPDVVLFLVSPAVDQAMIEDTGEALAEILAAHRGTAGRREVFRPPPLPERVITPRAAALRADRERVPVRQAVGRISAETIGCYPPGQAIFVAGERVTAEGIEYLQRALAAGGHLKRVQDDGFQTFEVLCQ